MQRILLKSASQKVLSPLPFQITARIQWLLSIMVVLPASVYASSMISTGLHGQRNQRAY